MHVNAELRIQVPEQRGVFNKCPALSKTYCVLLLQKMYFLFLFFQRNGRHCLHYIQIVPNDIRNIANMRRFSAVEKAVHF